MYELGSFNKFCTSVSVQQNRSEYFLARNLDYGYQEFLIENSIKLIFLKDGSPIFETIGHAGFIGAHSGLRLGGYAITLNERIDGGGH